MFKNLKKIISKRNSSTKSYKIDRLACIVTGMERSGTTYLSRIIMSHPKIWSGFECGVLLGNINNFYKNKPFCEWIEKRGWHFGLGQHASKNISKLKTYKEVYNYIYKHMGFIQKKEGDKLYKLFKEAKFIIDKTPRYCYSINNIVKKIDSETPLFIVYKEWKQQFYSMVVKRKLKPSTFAMNRKIFVEEIRKLNMNKNNIVLIKYDDLMNKEDKINNFIMNRIIDFNPKIKFYGISIDQYKEKTSRHINNLKICDYNFSKKQYKPYTIERSVLSNKMNNDQITILNKYDKILDKCKLSI